MSGLLTRIRRDRSAVPTPAAAPKHDPAAPSVPAGAEPDAASGVDRPGFRERGQLRRRLRYLRRIRELGFRDVGGLVFDLDRFGRLRDDLVREKLDALAAVDEELRAIEIALDGETSSHQLREAGIAGCPSCGALNASEMRFCPACGSALRDRATGGVATAFAVGVEGRAAADGAPDASR